MITMISPSRVSQIVYTAIPAFPSALESTVTYSKPTTSEARELRLFVMTFPMLISCVNTCPDDFMTASMRTSDLSVISLPRYLARPHLHLPTHTRVPIPEALPLQGDMMDRYSAR